MFFLQVICIFTDLFCINRLAGFPGGVGWATSTEELIIHGPDLHFLMNNTDRWGTTVLLLCMVRCVCVSE